METNTVKRKSKSAAQEYVGGDVEAARKELGDLAFEALGEVFPEAERSPSSVQRSAEPGAGFLVGVVVGAVLTFWLTQQLGGR